MTSTVKVLRLAVAAGAAAPQRGRDPWRPATVSAVVPARNEERNIGWVLRGMPATVDEVVLVDGFSRDRTIECAVRHCPMSWSSPNAVPEKVPPCARGSSRRPVTS